MNMKLRFVSLPQDFITWHYQFIGVFIPGYNEIPEDHDTTYYQRVGPTRELPAYIRRNRAGRPIRIPDLEPCRHN